jgi:hypothetical protein
MTREGMLGVALRAHENILALFTAKATFSSHFGGMGFVFGHEISLLKLGMFPE